MWEENLLDITWHLSVPWHPEPLPCLVQRTAWSFPIPTGADLPLPSEASGEKANMRSMSKTCECQQLSGKDLLCGDSQGWGQFRSAQGLSWQQQASSVEILVPHTCLQVDFSETLQTTQTWQCEFSSHRCLERPSLATEGKVGRIYLGCRRMSYSVTANYHCSANIFQVFPMWQALA